MLIQRLTRFTTAALFGTTIAVATAYAAEGLDATGRCVGDKDDNGAVTIDELIVGVNNSLDGCAYQPVTITFRAAVGSQPFACGSTYRGIGTTGATIDPSDFRFYVSHVRLVTADGAEVPVQLDQDGIWQYDDVALLDFENKEAPCTNGTSQTNRTVRGRVPVGAYTGLRFALGVPLDQEPPGRLGCAVTAEPHRDVLELAGRVQVLAHRHRSTTSCSSTWAARGVCTASPARCRGAPARIGPRSGWRTSMHPATRWSPTWPPCSPIRISAPTSPTRRRGACLVLTIRTAHRYCAISACTFPRACRISSHRSSSASSERVTG